MRIWHRVLQAILRGKSNRTNARNDTSLQLESLEMRSLLASHPLADAPDIDYAVTDEWSTGHTAALTLTNDESTSFSNWQLEFDYSGQIDSLWNATVTNLSGGRYAITPPDWGNTLDAGESLAIGISASGSSGISNITFNGTGAVAPEDPITPPVTSPEDPIDPRQTRLTLQSMKRLSRPRSIPIRTNYRSSPFPMPRSPKVIVVLSWLPLLLHFPDLQAK